MVAPGRQGVFGGLPAVVAFALAAGLALLAPGVSGVDFDPQLAGEWRFEEGEKLCRLHQPIPDFGEIEFIRRPGQPLVFRVIGKRQLFAEGDLEIGLSAPSWHPQYPLDRSVVTQPYPGGTAVDVPDPYATELLMAIREGHDPLVAHPGWYADDSRVLVRGASMNFGAMYAHFVDCFEALIPATWAEIERTSLGYRTDTSALSDADRRRLDLVADYIEADPTVARVYIDGHTDNSGTPSHNVELSRQRAMAVRDYLRGRGVEDVELVVRYHGSRYPVADNVDPAGRARNRRTTVRLERDPEGVAVR